MNIGLDAKRIFNNGTGLGVYGRNLLEGFQQCQSLHNFYLFAPQKESNHINVDALPPNFHDLQKTSFSSYYWRTWSIYHSIKKNNLDIYHGLSNELPFSLKKTKAKFIVDLHDLCFVHFKEDYSIFDQHIFWLKAKFAAEKSDKIIATSVATKQDILKTFNIPENKVEVVYQCCDASFYQEKNTQEINRVKQDYKLPDTFILCVGTIQGRKNQQAIIEAVSLLKKEKRLPILFVGNGKRYLQETIAFASSKNVELHVRNNVCFNDLPYVYQAANLFVYPSFIEGFGIPVLEAMASGVPVITSQKTSMAEIIQNEDALINPSNVNELSERILYFLENNMDSMVTQSKQRAQDFSQRKFAEDVLKVYDGLF